MMTPTMALILQSWRLGGQSEVEKSSTYDSISIKQRSLGNPVSEMLALSQNATGFLVVGGGAHLWIVFAFWLSISGKEWPCQI